MIGTFASLPPLASAVIGFALGLALGLIHFATLKTVTSLYLSGTATGRAIGLQLGRLAVLAATLNVLALSGAAALLGGALGVLAGRAIVLRRTKGERDG